MTAAIRLRQLAGAYAICRLAHDEAIPAWADGPGFVSISRSDDELSVVCLQDRIPLAVRRDADWTCFKLLGPFKFDQTGIVLSVIRPLSENRIGVFVVSTFDGDHLLVKAADRERAIALLIAAGHEIGQKR